MDTNGYNPPSARRHTNNEFQLSLHVLQHVVNEGEPRYTIGVWDSNLHPIGLRAICHAQPMSEALAAIAAEFRASTAPEEFSSTATAINDDAGTHKCAVDADSSDAPVCWQCGTLTRRNGSCFSCSNCGTSTGCG